jgi:predicted metalloprotease with PDZ domain
MVSELKVNSTKSDGRGARMAAYTALTALALLAVPFTTARFSARAQSNSAPIQIVVDLSEAQRHIFHAHMIFPAAPGPLTLAYPEWIPGEHMPDGPISDVAGVKFTAGGKPLAWRRDDVNMFEFHMDVPAGVNSVEAYLDYLNPVDGNGFSAGPSATPKTVILEWNDVLLYPAGTKSDDVRYSPSLKLPAGFQYGTALRAAGNPDNGTIHFDPVSLTNLVDSPVLAGAFFRSIPVATDIQPPHHLDLAGDSAESVDIPQDELDEYSRLVREAQALFGAHHYDHYDFLLSLSDHFFPNGLEHHQSSDNRAPERMLLDPDLREMYADLLPHEFTHSWNGKYRRPVGLATGDFFTPMKGDLLWVYEGMTQYWGETLSTRSGLRSEDAYREALAATAAYLDHQAGREWRPLQDTATAAQTLYLITSKAWFSWRRNVDFYDESWLIWLEADSTIRTQTGNKKSLDDFCKLFHGAPSTPPKVVPYNLDDVVTGMNQIAPYDWRKFFRDRLDYTGPHAPLGGITGSGWKLIYNDTPNAHIQSDERTGGDLNFEYSLGMNVNANGSVLDVVPGMPAANAGLAPGMRILSVNGRGWSVDALHDAVRSTRNRASSIEVNVENLGFAGNARISYHGGEMYPHLVRDESHPDLLSDILRPLTPAGASR